MDYDDYQEDDYDDDDTPTRRYVPAALKGVVGKKKSKPWQTDAASWKQQMQARKTVFDGFAVLEEKKSFDSMDQHVGKSNSLDGSVGLVEEEEEEFTTTLSYNKNAQHINNNNNHLPTTTASPNTPLHQQQQQQTRKPLLTPTGLVDSSWYDQTPPPKPSTAAMEVVPGSSSSHSYLSPATPALVDCGFYHHASPSPQSSRVVRQRVQLAKDTGSSPVALQRARASLSNVLKSYELRSVVLHTDAVQRTRKSLLVSDVQQSSFNDVDPSPAATSVVVPSRTDQQQQQHTQKEPAPKEPNNNKDEALIRARTSLSNVLTFDSLRQIVMSTDAVQRTRKSLVMSHLHQPKEYYLEEEEKRVEPTTPAPTTSPQPTLPPRNNHVEEEEEVEDYDNLPSTSVPSKSTPSPAPTPALVVQVEEEPNYENDKLQTFRKSLVLSDLEREVPLTPDKYTRTAVQQQSPNNILPSVVPSMMMEEDKATTTTTSSSMPSSNTKNNDASPTTTSSESSPDDCYENDKLQTFRKSLVLTDLQRQIPETPEHTPIHGSTSGVVQPTTPTVSLLTGMLTKEVVDSSFVGNKDTIALEVVADDTNEPNHSSTTNDPPAKEEEVEKDRLQQFRKSLVLTDLQRSLPQLVDAHEIETVGGQDGSSSVEDPRAAFSNRGIEHTGDSPQIAAELSDGAGEASEELSTLEQQQQQQHPLLDQPSPTTSQSPRTETTKKEDNIYETRKSLVLSDLSQHLQVLYTDDRHSLEAAGQGGIPKPKSSPVTIDTTTIKHRGSVLNELQVRVSLLSTDHHHVVTSPVSEEEVKASIEEESCPPVETNEDEDEEIVVESCEGNEERSTKEENVSDPETMESEESHPAEEESSSLGAQDKDTIEVEPDVDAQPFEEEGQLTIEDTTQENDNAESLCSAEGRVEEVVQIEAEPPTSSKAREAERVIEDIFSILSPSFSEDSAEQSPNQQNKRESLKGQKWKDRLAKKATKKRDSTETVTEGKIKLDADIVPSPVIEKKEMTITRVENKEATTVPNAEDKEDSIEHMVDAENSTPIAIISRPITVKTDIAIHAEDDKEATDEAPGSELKKQDKPKGEKWKEIIAKKALKKRESERCLNVDEAESEKTKEQEQTESSLGTVLKSPPGKDGKSKKWKDRIAKKRESKIYPWSKIESPVPRNAEKSNLAVDIKPPIEVGEDTGSPGSQDGESSTWEEDRIANIKETDVQEVDKSTVEVEEKAKSETGVNRDQPAEKFRDQLRSSIMAFDAKLNTRPTIPQDEESVWTEVTMAATPLKGSFPESAENQNSSHAEDRSYIEYTVADSFTEESPLKDAVDKKKSNANPYMASLLSSRMFSDDMHNHSMEVLQDGNANFPTITCDAGGDDDMTQVTFDHSLFMGDDSDEDNADNDIEKVSKDKTSPDGKSFTNTVQDNTPSIGAGSQRSGPSRRGAGRQDGGSSSSQVSEATKQRMAQILRKDIWGRDTSVVQSSLEELSTEAGRGHLHRANIVRFGGVMAIIRAMDMNLDHATIQIAACVALEKMALDSETQLAIGEVGGISAIVGAMKEHIEQIGVQQAACTALASISKPREGDGSANDDLTIEADGVVPAICTTMTRYANDAKIQAKSFVALANLCMYNQERLAELATLGGIMTMTMALQKPWESIHDQQEAISNLSILLRGIAEQQAASQVSKPDTLENKKVEMKPSVQKDSNAPSNDLDESFESAECLGSTSPAPKHTEETPQDAESDCDTYGFDEESFRSIPSEKETEKEEKSDLKPFWTGVSDGDLESLPPLESSEGDGVSQPAETGEGQSSGKGKGEECTIQ